MSKYIGEDYAKMLLELYQRQRQSGCTRALVAGSIATEAVILTHDEVWAAKLREQGAAATSILAGLRPWLGTNLAWMVDLPVLVPVFYTVKEMREEIDLLRAQAIELATNLTMARLNEQSQNSVIRVLEATVKAQQTDQAVSRAILQELGVDDADVVWCKSQQEVMELLLQKARELKEKADAAQTS